MDLGFKTRITLDFDAMLVSKYPVRDESSRSGNVTRFGFRVSQKQTIANVGGKNRSTLLSNVGEVGVLSQNKCVISDAKQSKVQNENEGILRTNT